MSAIETCRTAALGGHIEGCEGPPYPSLRPARQRRSQGKCRACARTARRCSKVRPGDGCCHRTRKSSTAMPMLWRPNDHHRNFRTPDATARAAAGTPANPDDGVVTRHDQPRLRVEAARLPTPNSCALQPEGKPNSILITQIAACCLTLWRAKNPADGLHHTPPQCFKPLPQPSRYIRRFIKIHKNP